MFMCVHMSHIYYVYVLLNVFTLVRPMLFLVLVFALSVKTSIKKGSRLKKAGGDMVELCCVSLPTEPDSNIRWM